MWNFCSKQGPNIEQSCWYGEILVIGVIVIYILFFYLNRGPCLGWGGVQGSSVLSLFAIIALEASEVCITHKENLTFSSVC